MADEELLVSRCGALGHIRLNRPKALNSLTLGMVRVFTRALDEFGADPEIAAVLVTGEGERGLCAGGDIRALHGLREGDKSHYKTFWREEYALNARIAAFAKLYVVIMDGLVMGGGVGISAHGNRRIVTERTRLAMPETGIGFIPDVGGTWLLTRDGGAGVYMALSGAIVSAADALHVGLADSFIESRRISELVQQLSRLASPGDVDAILEDFARPHLPSALAFNRETLDNAMAGDSVEEILASLHAADSIFARAAAKEIAEKSPLSLKVTLALLKAARIADRLETCLAHEYRAACRLLETHDLYEGIRAAVIDKDRAPKWRPASLAEIDDATVAGIILGDGAPDPILAAPT
jgi:enoyl-CoA hydratase